MNEIPTFPRAVVTAPTPLATDDQITEIRLSFSRIRRLSEEYMHQAGEMWEELDQPPPRLIAKQELLSAAWASITALAESGDSQTARLEERIAQSCRSELPPPRPPHGTDPLGDNTR